MYDSALKSQPTDANALLYRSFAHVLRPNPRLDLAARDADSIINLDPANSKAWKQKGDVLRRQGDLKGAVEALTCAVGCAQGVDRLETQALLNSTQTALAQQSIPAPTQNISPPSIDQTVSTAPSILPERPKKTPEPTSPTQPSVDPPPTQPALQSTVSNASNSNRNTIETRPTDLDETEPAPAQGGCSLT